jgi:hypothetical protein
MRFSPLASILAFAVALPAPAFSATSEASEIVAPRMVVIATLDNVEAARREARRAATLLDYPVAQETMTRVSARRNYVGAVITLLRVAKGKIAVTSYLGDAADAEDELVRVRKYFPTAIVVATTVDPDAKDAGDAPFFRAGILVVGSYASYPAALAAAKAFSRASGVAYESQGMIYDKKRGLIWPDDSSDEVYAGQYAPRRYDQCGDKSCVTIERSAAYEGFRPGLYIVVAGIVGRDSDGEARLKAARAIVPFAYVKQTTLYMGCMH